jgi:hypothetical protein
MKAKEFEIKKRDPNWKTMQDIRRSGAGGQHKDKKKAAKQGEVKHKSQIAEGDEPDEQYLDKVISDLHKDALGMRPDREFGREWMSSSYEEKLEIYNNMLKNLHSDLDEATGDEKFDTIMRTIKKGTKKQATADRREREADSRQRARDAFGPSPADRLSIRSNKDVDEGIGGTIVGGVGQFFGNKIDPLAGEIMRAHGEIAGRKAEYTIRKYMHLLQKALKQQLDSGEKEGVAEGHTTEKQIMTRIRQIMHDRKLSGTESNAGELHRLKQQLKDMRSQQSVAEAETNWSSGKGGGNNFFRDVSGMQNQRSAIKMIKDGMRGMYGDEIAGKLLRGYDDWAAHIGSDDINDVAKAMLPGIKKAWPTRNKRTITDIGKKSYSPPKERDRVYWDGDEDVAEGSDWGEPREILEDVLQTLEREVEWPLTEVMDPKEVRQLLSPLVRAVNDKLLSMDRDGNQ